MAWLVAWLVLGLGLGYLCQGAVNMPFLYGLFIVGLVLLPAAIIYDIVRAVIDAMFNHRR